MKVNEEDITHAPQGYNLQYIYPALNRHRGSICFCSFA